MADLSANAAEVLANGREAAEALMVDACTITRAAPGEPTLDESTGTYPTVPPTTIYDGPCKVQQARTVAPGQPEAGEREWTVLDVEVHVPIAVAGIEVDDVVTITAAAHDPSLVDRTYRVTDDPAKSFATARRLRCEETVR